MKTLGKLLLLSLLYTTIYTTIIYATQASAKSATEATLQATTKPQIQSLEFDLSSDNSISIQSYSISHHSDNPASPANPSNKKLLIYLPSEYGLGQGYPSLAKRLSKELAKQLTKDLTKNSHITIWLVDLHTSYMLSPGRSSLKNINIADLLELLQIAQQQGYTQSYLIASGRGAQLALNLAHQHQLQQQAKQQTQLFSNKPSNNKPSSNKSSSNSPSNKPFIRGHIFHSPHLLNENTAIGTKATYTPIAQQSNLPIYILLPQFGTKYFRDKEIQAELKKGGSQSHVHHLQGLQAGFYKRPEETLDQRHLNAKKQLPKLYQNAIQWIDNTTIGKLKNPNQAPKTKQIKPTHATTLRPYKGKQNIPLNHPTLSGKPFDIQNLRQQIVLVNFWVSWCKPCLDEIPSLQRLEKHLTGKPFKIITINVGEPAPMVKSLIKKFNITFPTLLDSDGKFAKSWNIYAYPTSFILDKQGTIKYAYLGGLEWDHNNIIKTIESLF